MVSRFLWSVVVLVVVLVHDARGQRPDSVRTVVLDGVTVEAERPDGPALRLQPTRVRPGLDLAGMLSGVGGVDIRQYGANGSAHLSLRGLPAGHTEILLDGIPLTHPQTGQVDLSLLPMTGVRATSIAGGLGDGSGGLGGGLHLEVGPNETGVTSHVVAGSWGERRYAIEASGEGLGGRGMLAWQGVSAPGTFPFQDAYAWSNSARTRDGAGRSSQSLLAHVSIGERVRTNVLAWWSALQRGLPGPVNSPPGEAWQSTSLKRIQASMDAGATKPGDGVRYRAEGAWTHHDLAWRDPSAHAIPGSDVLASTGFLRLRAGWIRDSARARLVLTPMVRLEHNRARQSGVTARDGSATEAQGMEWRVDWGMAVARTTGRSHADGFLTLLSAPGVRGRFRGGLTFARDVVPDVRLRAAGGHSVRLATFMDRYGIPGGNPDLRPERGWTAELGVDVRSLSLTTFRTDLRDRIIWRPMLAGAGTSVVQVYTPENVGRVVSRGVEIRLGGQWPRAQRSPSNRLTGARGDVHLSWSLHGTLVAAVDRSHSGAPAFNHQLRYTPTRLAGGSVRAALRAWQMDVAARHTGRRFMTSDETRWLTPQSSFDLSLGRTTHVPGARLHVWLSLKNVFDAHLEGMRLYPMPPRHFEGGISLRTRP